LDNHIFYFYLFNYQRTLSARSDRAKAVDLHSSEPWVLVCLYNGNCHVWDHQRQTLIKSFEVTDLPGNDFALLLHRKKTC